MSDHPGGENRESRLEATSQKRASNEESAHAGIKTNSHYGSCAIITKDETSECKGDGDTKSRFSART